MESADEVKTARVKQLSTAAKKLVAAATGEQDKRSANAVARALDACTAAFHGLLKHGGTYEEAHVIFTSQVGAALGELGAHELKNGAENGGFEPLEQAAASSSSNFVARELASVLVNKDIYSLHRTARDKLHAESRNPVKVAWRATKDLGREVSAKHGARAAFVKKWEELEKNDREARLYVATATAGFAHAEAHKKIEMAGRGIAAILKIRENCKTQDDFMRHLQAALLRVDPSLVKEYASILALYDLQKQAPTVMPWLAEDGQKSLGAIKACFEAVAALFPIAGGANVQPAEQSYIPQGRPRNVTPDGKVPENDSPRAAQSKITAAQLSGAGRALAMALSSARDASPSQQGDLGIALENACRAFTAAITSGGLPAIEAFALIGKGAKDLLDFGDATAIKNAQVTESWLRVKVDHGGIVERNILRGILDLDFHTLHREQRDDEHALDAVHAKGIDRLAQPVLAGVRAAKDTLRDFDTKYGPRKARLEAAAGDVALREQAIAQAGKAVTATQNPDADDRDAELLNGICGLLDFQLAEKPGANDDDRVKAHIEDALIRMPIDKILLLEGSLGDAWLMGHVKEAFKAAGQEKLVPRLDLLPQAITNVRGVHGVPKRVTIA